MSQTPDSLRDLKKYLVAKTGREGRNFGIRGVVGSRRVWGYHLGKSDIYGPGGYKDKDYSVKHPRDKAGLSEASAGFDIRLPVKQLIALNKYLRAEAKAGRADLMEIIGPDEKGEAKRWVSPNWDKALDASDDHEWHDHLSFPRDTEFGDRIAMFEGHFGPRDAGPPPPPPPPPPDPGSEPPPEDPDDERIAELEEQVESLEQEKAGLETQVQAAQTRIENARKALD